MSRFEGSLARWFDFDAPAARPQVPGTGAGRGGSLRLALPGGVLRGPDKYKVLEHRRRQAQIRARRLLAMMEEVE